MLIRGLEALRCAVKIIGSQSAVARVIGIRPQSVNEILLRGHRVPAEWCIPLENATRAKGEEITRHQLRPDLYPDDSDARAA